ncbi:WhiB family transcriptional regulator, partial [Streptomyces sp. MCAF7]
MQLKAHTPSVATDLIPPPDPSEDSLTPLTALTELDEAIENLGVA